MEVGIIDSIARRAEKMTEADSKMEERGRPHSSAQYHFRSHSPASFLAQVTD